MPPADRLRAVDLLTGHDSGCGWRRGYTCVCNLATRQQAARDIDARTEALEQALREARAWLAICDPDPDHKPRSAPGRQWRGLLARIDALLAEVTRGR